MKANESGSRDRTRNTRALAMRETVAFGRLRNAASWNIAPLPSPGATADPIIERVDF
jgi:hypothetical protein